MTHSITPTRPRDSVFPVDSYSFFRELTETATQVRSRTAFLKRSLPELVRVLNLNSAAIVTQRRGGWKVDAWSGSTGNSGREVSNGDATRFGNSTPTQDGQAGPQLPMDLIASAIDSGSPEVRQAWVAIPSNGSFSQPTENAERHSCLIVNVADATDRAGLTRVCSVFLSHTAMAEQCERQRERIQQLSQVLRASAKWQRNQLQPSSDEDSLLKEIAETAITLLNCQRVSIFLWDKRRKKLVGKPSVGIEAPLVISDDAGIVGEVLATGEAQIWNGGDDDESRVNRSVDQSLDFQTTSLVAVR